MDDERSQLLQWFDEEQAYIDACLSTSSQGGEAAAAPDGNDEDRWMEVLCALCWSGNPALVLAVAAAERELQREMTGLEEANERLLEEVIATGRRIPLTMERLKALRERTDRIYDVMDRRDRVLDQAADWLLKHPGLGPE